MGPALRQRLIQISSQPNVRLAAKVCAAWLLPQLFLQPYPPAPFLLSLALGIAALARPRTLLSWVVSMLLGAAVTIAWLSLSNSVGFDVGVAMLVLRLGDVAAYLGLGLAAFFTLFYWESIDRLLEPYSRPVVRVLGYRLPAGGESQPPHLLIAGCALAALMVLYLSFVNLWVIDDAYISYRYAWNLVHGKGLTFNAGERVEGYSNLLWVLVSAFGILSGAPIEVFGVWVGILCGAIAFAVAFRFGCRRTGAPVWQVSLVLLAFMLSPTLWRCVGGGLESGLQALLLVLTIVSAAAGRARWTSLCLGLLAAVRPEALAFVPIYWLVLLFSGTKFKQSLICLAPGLVLAISLEAFRLAYYHALVPNSVTAKSPIEWSKIIYDIQIATGTLYLKSFVQMHIFPILLAAVGIWITRNRIESKLAIGLMAWQCVTVLIGGGDWVPEPRFLLPYLPMLAVFGCYGLQVWSRLARPVAPAVALASGVNGLLVMPITLGNGGREPREEFLRTSPSFHIGNSTKSMDEWQSDCRLATYLRDALIPSDTISPERLGLPSYLMIDHYSHDFLGLTDLHISRHGRAWMKYFGKTDYRYSVNQIRPTVFLTLGTGNLMNMVRAERRMPNNYRFFFGGLYGLAIRNERYEIARELMAKGIPLKEVDLRNVPDD
ncbi:MAG: hypothetical protein JSS72_02670 [Armatimonadetes bacterium]|nr:hypothetical protein [Armatimonadota bacterium]